MDIIDRYDNEEYWEENIYEDDSEYRDEPLSAYGDRLQDWDTE